MGTFFAKYYDVFMEPLERRRFRDIRKKLVGKARGKVLEIGSGTGLNFPYYEQAETVIAIEPEPYMRKKSVARAQKAHVPIKVMDGDAQNLPFPDDSFDTVVATLVLCTIPDPVLALREIRRVCKPEGRVLLFEHVRLNHPIWGSLQDWLTPIWKRLCDGCHLNRNTLEWIEKAGLRVIRLEKYSKDIFLVIEAVNELFNDDNK
ncbi:class I SAM-dependent methyltransferase [Bacillaceae bacterium]